MEFICLSIIISLIIVILAIVFKINVKQVKKVAVNKELDTITNKYPQNIEICKKILKKLNNENVEIEEDKEAKNCLYIVTTNKILIAKKQEGFSRIQTIAHECIHSIQNKQLLMFNFIYTNIYLVSFFTLVILAILKKIPNPMLFVNIFTLMGIVQYVVRSYLEYDAMYKAKFLAKEYMEQENVASQEEISKVVYGFNQINSLGIKGTNFSLIFNVLIKTLILCVILAIRM